MARPAVSMMLCVSCVSLMGALGGCDNGNGVGDMAGADTAVPMDLSTPNDLSTPIDRTGLDSNPPVDMAMTMVDTSVAGPDIASAPPDLTPVFCTSPGATRGSAIAVTPDDSRLVVVNRDSGSVTVMSIDYSDGQPKMTVVAELAVGAEPWQVAIDGCGKRAFVVLRKDQKVVAIDNIDSTPVVGKSVAVGSEPTALALTPNGTQLWVSNWVDGTLSVIDPTTMTMTRTVDLNSVIAATGLLGTVTARPSLAHPRGIAFTNNGDASDTDETAYVTEWFAARTGPENATGTNSDHNWKGLLYKVSVMTGTASTIDLPPIIDTGFNDAKGQATGCFPNQVASVTIDGRFAYVTSTCASPVGPTGVFQKGSCVIDANCTGGLAGSCFAGSCKGSCTVDSDCGAGAPAGTCNLAAGGACGPLTANAKTTTHPAVTIVDLAGGSGTTFNLDKLFTSTSSTQLGTVSGRIPLLPTDIDFKPGFGYVSSEGADGLFRLVINNGVITKVGSATNNFIDVRNPGTTQIRLPIGLAMAHAKALSFVANDGTRTVTAVDLNTQAISVGMSSDIRVTASSPLPTAGSAAESVLNGKRFFNTGLGRWSLQGAGWGSCGACHIDGLTDNVTWYFARGPRQTISLDGTFASSDPNDQRILNWTAIFDEIADFEGNVRGISGGVGALVRIKPAACTVATQATDCPNSLVCNPATLLCNIDAKDRINLLTETPQQQGLQGSSDEIANPVGLSSHPHTVISDWRDITNWIKTLRSPRRPTNLVATDITAGKMIFGDPTQGNCIGCHSGAKWTFSKRFYTPGDVPNDAFASATPTSLSYESWNAPVPGFPAALFPSTTGGKQTMRSGAPPAFEQLQCVLRPVGTIIANGAVPTGVSDPMINVLELRQDMVTGAQGAGGVNANDFTRGFNPPSLLGMQIGAPLFHAGNARSLEELFDSRFIGHHQSAIAQVFSPSATQVKQLVAYLLSIDESEPPFNIPAAGSRGGDICYYP